MNVSRCRFLWKSTAAGGALLAIHRGVHAAGSDVIRVGLVGCGSRGTGAAIDAQGADPGAKPVALGNAFEDRVESSRGKLGGPFSRLAMTSDILNNGRCLR